MKLFLPLFLAVITFSNPAIPIPKPYGEIRILVVDGKTNEPIENANICVLECERYFKTSALGYSPKMPVETEDHTDMPPFSRAKVTLLVYKEGYLDTLVFGVEVFDGICRLGPTVRLFQKTALDGGIKMQYDFPDEKLLSSIVEKYKK